MDVSTPRRPSRCARTGGGSVTRRLHMTTSGSSCRRRATGALMACARPSNAVTNAVVDTPEVRYARRDGRAIAYQVWGSGPLVTLFITEWPGVSDVLWEHPLH